MGRLQSSLISGLPATWVKLRAGVALARISFQTFKSTGQALKALIRLIRQLNRMHGNIRNHKIVLSHDRYYWSIYTPGFPSNRFNSFIQREINSTFNGSDAEPPLQTLILSISNRCHYQCEHCFEGDNLQPTEFLTYETLSRVVDDAVKNGIMHMQLGGGEPMLRFDDMVRLMRQADDSIDFWLSTSGYGLTPELAKTLRKSGLTGATISLDHWDENLHNQFRQHTKAYQWALKAVKNCNEAGIITNLTICIMRNTANAKDLMKYMELARRVNVSFVSFLEARNAGNFAGKDIMLRTHEQEAVRDFYLKLNSERRFNAYPIIHYLDYHQRKLGCYGAGNRYLHIDARGNYHGCPFCSGTVGNIEAMSIREAMGKLQEKECPVFPGHHDFSGHFPGSNGE